MNSVEDDKSLEVKQLSHMREHFGNPHKELVVVDSDDEVDIVMEPATNSLCG